MDVDYSTGDNLLDGGDGNDYLSASGEGSDLYRYTVTPSTLGTSGNNTLNGGSGNDTLDISYSEGNNLLDGGDGNDYLSASGIDDTIRGGSGNNTLNGGAGNDTLDISYSTGNNLLDGGDGNDYLSASGLYYSSNGGNDTLSGGRGNDSLYGGSDTDTFVFNSLNEGIDTLYDFNATNELIQVSAAGFGGGLSIGSLKASQFTIGTSATTSAERFIYNSATGGLFFDSDGSASRFTQVQFAQLDAGLSLSEKNFVVV